MLLSLVEDTSTVFIPTIRKFELKTIVLDISKKIKLYSLSWGVNWLMREMYDGGVMPLIDSLENHQ